MRRGRFLPVLAFASLVAGVLLSQDPQPRVPAAALDLGGLDTRAAALILSGEEGGDLGVSVMAEPLRGVAEQVWVAVLIDIEDGEDTGLKRLTEIYAYALDADGEVAGFLTQGFVLEPGEAGGVKFVGHLDLTSGDYSLRVLARQRPSDRWALSVTPLAVPPETAGTASSPLVVEAIEGRVLVREAPPAGGGGDDFPQILVVDVAAAPEESSAAAAVAVKEPAARLRHSQVSADYTRALRHLSDGDVGAARGMILDMELSAIGSLRQEFWVEELLALAERLSRRCKECLVPMIWLHDELYREHHRQRRFGLSTHARRMVSGLSAFYAGAGTAESRQLVAGVLVSLAGYLQETGSVGPAEDVFRQALDHDAGQEGALLGLAAIREAYGDYKEADELLERLLKRHPGNSEARLRRAICLRRLGSVRRAEPLFRDVLSGEAPTWVRAVAYQELAHLYVADDRLDEAAALLVEARERLPAEQRFHLQLAAVYDRMRRPAEGRAALAELDPEAGRDSETPRLIYSRWPRKAVEAARRGLEEAAEGRLPVLAEALAELTGQEG